MYVNANPEHYVEIEVHIYFQSPINKLVYKWDEVYWKYSAINFLIMWGVGWLVVGWVFWGFFWY